MGRYRSASSRFRRFTLSLFGLVVDCVLAFVDGARLICLCVGHGWNLDLAAALRRLYGLVGLPLLGSLRALGRVGTRDCGAGCQIVGGGPLSQFSPDLLLPQIGFNLAISFMQKASSSFTSCTSSSHHHHRILEWTGGWGSDGTGMEEESR